jgi:hypothetical protein
LDSSSESNTGESKLSVRRVASLATGNTVRKYWFSPSEIEEHPLLLLDLQYFSIKTIFCQEVSSENSGNFEKKDEKR